MSKMRKRVLIIEDEKPIARALELKLRSVGIDAQNVFDGEEALEVLQKEHFDHIILDLVMPKLDGFGVLRELKTRNDKTPVTVISHLSQPEDVKRVRELGITDYFVKSDVPIAEVVGHIRDALKT